MNAATENGTLTATVGVESGGEDICLECPGQVEYEPTIAVGRRPPAALAVDHEHLEGTNEVARRELDGQSVSGATVSDPPSRRGPEPNRTRVVSTVDRSAGRSSVDR